VVWRLLESRSDSKNFWFFLIFWKCVIFFLFRLIFQLSSHIHPRMLMRSLLTFGCSFLDNRGRHAGATRSNDFSSHRNTRTQGIFSLVMDAKHCSTVTVFIKREIPSWWMRSIVPRLRCLSRGKFPRDGRKALRCLSRRKFPRDGCEALFHGYGVYLGGTSLSSLVMDASTFLFLASAFLCEAFNTAGTSRCDGCGAVRHVRRGRSVAAVHATDSQGKRWVAPTAFSV
jgi:hypothetical protein